MTNIKKIMRNLAIFWSQQNDHLFYSFTYKNNFLSKIKLLTFIKFVSLFKINVEEAKNVHII